MEKKIAKLIEFFSQNVRLNVTVLSVFKTEISFV